MSYGCMLAAMGQYSISGHVQNEEGRPLPGATVQLIDTKYGTSTDNQGSFVFNRLPAGHYTLQVSYVGFVAAKQPVSLSDDVELSIRLEESLFLGDQVVVYATRANEKTPTTYSNVEKEKITERNLGVDLPILLNFTPSVVTTSDAGAGVGYTGMRIRGSDGTRINVTVNGIPLNDSESHGVYWVNMPDFATSVDNIQIQRGVGTSSNGAAAFGATVNLQTNRVSQEAFAQVDNSVGSFHTWKSNVTFNTGLLPNRFNFETRLSRIVSDGYIDRASSDLKSYYAAGGYYGEKTMIKALVFGGKEITYQAWYGTPQARLQNDEAGLQDVIAWGGEYVSQGQIDNLLNSGRQFNYYLYDNEVDNYAQDHYQLHVNHSFSENFNFNGALHYTYGRGYYEQYRQQDLLAAYGLENVLIRDSLITRTDLIRRRWLDNDFYGATYSFNYTNSRVSMTLGGGYNIYDGDHFGEMIWAQYASDSQIRNRYYEGVGIKKDFNSFVKVNYQLAERLNLFGDAQVRAIGYHTYGTDNDLSSYDTGGDYVFINPKGGLTYTLSDQTALYASFAVANREPVRTDFIDAPNGKTPLPETLRNIEAGIRRSGTNVSVEANYYLMQYKNQLVLTGALNDVGSPIRTNVDGSYRTGVELSGKYLLTEQLSWAANVTLSRNRITSFTEVMYDYAFAYGDPQFVWEKNYRNTAISFSPNVIAGSDLAYTTGGLTLQLLSKYVGKQYLDNTGNEERTIDSYLINDVRVSYDFSIGDIQNVRFSVLANNILNVEYASNGYTWGYLWDGWQYQQNNYYPQAGTNFLAGLSVKF